MAGNPSRLTVAHLAIATTDYKRQGTPLIRSPNETFMTGLEQWFGPADGSETNGQPVRLTSDPRQRASLSILLRPVG
ncbi:hypothetical protein JTE90_022505 [Oedothorax gibbosus]|uniref:Uncharacterized protein n=1 Tax=Oedothorax gibbosus TaxID=931172 RepID=A0AAV6V287_9ARAC|nr:hypothetical protein JTE90_022505 [Oedothorax gibbosus]